MQDLWGLTRMRILLVEDEAKVARFISQGLKEHNYVVDVASDGDMASEFTYVEDYDLLIVDIMIPKKNGIRFIRELRSNGKTLLFSFSAPKIP